ncbi:MAG: DUF3127 domain-containing protein [Bacteroidota bacterium]|jgi:hypothetical protein
MALEITGKIIQIMDETSGTSKTGNAWTKQEFVIETFDKFPKKVMISTMGDKVAELKKFKAGDQIKASLNLESREWQGRWFTDVRAWKIEGDGQQGSSAPQDTFYPDQDPGTTVDSPSDDLPF